MAKRKAFLHVGLDDRSADFLDAALELHEHALADLGVRRPAASAEEMFRAAIEIRRDHRAWGYARAEVEGAWSRICRRADRGKDTVVFSQPLLAEATSDQIALLLDALAGFKTHVVITVAAPDTWSDPALDLGAIIDRWTNAVGKPERVHVIVVPPDRGRKAVWKAFGRIVGFGTASLPLDGVGKPLVERPQRLVSIERQDVLRQLGLRWGHHVASRAVDVHGDLGDLGDNGCAVADAQQLVDSSDQALGEALRELERLARRNDTLVTRVGELERKQRRLRRRESDSSVA